MLGLGFGLGFTRGGSGGGGAAPPSIPPSLQGQSTMVAFGDSITNGQGVSGAQAYRTLVGAALAATVTNSGINSTPMQNTFTTAGSAFASNGRDRYASALTGGNKKDICIVMYGSNDLGRDREIGTYTGFNIVKFVDDYREVVAGLISAGYAADKIVLCSLPFISDYNNGSWDGGDVALHERYNAWIKQIAYEYDTLFSDVYVATRDGGGASLLQADGVHPTAAGHTVIANTILYGSVFVTSPVIAETDLVRFISAIDFSYTGSLTLSGAEITKAYDFSGNENHVTNGSAGVRPSSGVGTIGGQACADYDGGDYLTYGKTSLGNTSLFCTAGEQFTISTIVSPDNAGSLIAKAGATSALRAFMLTISSVGGVGPATHIRGTPVNTVYNTGAGADIQVTFTWDGTVALLYLNGGVGTPVTVGVAANEVIDIILGARTGGTGFFYNGRMGTMKVADSLLTAGQMNTVFGADAARFGLPWTDIL